MSGFLKKIKSDGGMLSATDIFVAVIFCVLALAAWVIINQIQAPHGTVAADMVVDPTKAPQQGIILQPEPWEVDDSRSRVVLTPVADYRIAARVLSTYRYDYDDLGDVVPIDLALGWGIMSRDDVVSKLSINQNSRAYSFWGSDMSLDYDEIARSSANLHAFPANQNVRRALFSLHRGDIILLDGKLINIDGADGDPYLRRRTSTTRDDSGAGACEIMYITSVVHDGKIYN